MKFKNGDYIRYVGHPQWTDRAVKELEGILKNVRYLKIKSIDDNRCVMLIYIDTKFELPSRFSYGAITDIYMETHWNDLFVKDSFVIDKHKQFTMKLNRILK